MLLKHSNVLPSPDTSNLMNPITIKPLCHYFIVITCICTTSRKKYNQIGRFFVHYVSRLKYDNLLPVCMVIQTSSRVFCSAAPDVIIDVEGFVFLLNGLRVYNLYRFV